MVRLVLLALFMSGCGNPPVQTSRAEKAAATVKVAEPETMAGWIAAENAKKRPCKASDGLNGWLGSGSNGYDSWDEKCEHGVTVYTDTTKETQERLAKEQAHKNELARALISRCLTAKEFAEVTELGYELYVQPMAPYFQDDIQSRFTSALLTQQILRQRCP